MKSNSSERVEFSIGNDDLALLEWKAEEMGMKKSVLVRRLMENIIRDDLYAAVLNEDAS